MSSGSVKPTQPPVAVFVPRTSGRQLGPLNSHLPLHATPSPADPLPHLRPPVLPTPSPPCRTNHQPPSSPKNVRSAPLDKGKKIAIHNSFQELARSDDDDPEAPVVDPCPGTPS
ncbi:hypothetical protein Salat_2383500 [Sesamum alatum]|uniref:Uncharacterized protein n=1 Tax=Sesamum alatum TaxID=300844 RepID=A0AAE2CEZ6_9LAMI|nr:hypothetical protein Salat_2383500 [Sesamum alatum]